MKEGTWDFNWKFAQELDVNKKIARFIVKQNMIIV